MNENYTEFNFGEFRSNEAETDGSVKKKEDLFSAKLNKHMRTE